MKSPRNKTIDIGVEEGAEFLKRVLRPGIKEELPEDIRDLTILGDSTELKKKLPEGFADLIIADTPYNLDKDFNGESFRKLSDDDYEEYTEGWVKLTKRLLKDNGTIYVCCDWRSGNAVYKVLKRHFKIRNRITWQREKGRGARGNWKSCLEDIWFATAGDNYKFNLDAVKVRRRVIAPYRTEGKPRDWEETKEGNFRNTHPSNFWDDISVPYWSMPENTAHPTQKPEKLLAKLILASSDPGDMVFDPFLGSGTTSVTAKKLGRHYLGIEQNERYCVWAEKRLAMAESDKTIQGYRDGIFWERNSGK